MTVAGLGKKKKKKSQWMYFKAIILFLKCATSDCISATLPLMEMLFPKMVLAFLLSLNLCKVCLLSLSPCVGLSFSPCIWHYLPCTPPPTATSQIPPTRDDNIWLWKKVCGDWLGWDARPQLLQGKRGAKVQNELCSFCLVSAFCVQSPVDLNCRHSNL